MQQDSRSRSGRPPAGDFRMISDRRPPMPPGGSLGQGFSASPNEPAADESDGAADYTGWGRMTWVVFEILLGVGLFQAPGIYQRLGWIPAFTLLWAFSAVATYSGTLYARMMSELPWVTTFGQLGARAAGRWGVVLVAVTAYAAIFSIPTLFHLSATHALQKVFDQSQLPTPLILSFIVTGVVMPLVQIQSLSEIALLSVLGGLASVVAIAGIGIKLLFVDPAPDEPPKTQLFENPGFFSSTVGILNCVFIFSGAENWVRCLAAMGPKREARRSFRLSTLIAYTLFAPLVTALGSVGYMTRGGSLDVSAEITDALVHDQWTQYIGLVMVLGVIIEYVVHVNIATQVFLELVAPRQFDHPHGHTVGFNRDIPPQAHRHEHAPLPRQGMPPSGVQPSQFEDSASVPLLSASYDSPAPSTFRAASHPPDHTLWTTLRTESEVDRVLGTGAVCESLIKDVQGTASSTRTDKVATGARHPASAQPGQVTRPALHEGKDSATKSLRAQSLERVHVVPEHEDLSEGNQSDSSPTAFLGSSRMLWAMTSVTIVLLAWGTSSLVPRYAEIMAVISAVGPLSCLFFVPAFFALRILRMSFAEKAVCWLMCCSSLVLTGFGLYASIHQLLVADP